MEGAVVSGPKVKGIRPQGTDSVIFMIFNSLNTAGHCTKVHECARVCICAGKSAKSVLYMVGSVCMHILCIFICKYLCLYLAAKLIAEMNFILEFIQGN